MSNFQAGYAGSIPVTRSVEPRSEPLGSVRRRVRWLRGIGAALRLTIGPSVLHQCPERPRRSHHVGGFRDVELVGVEAIRQPLGQLAVFLMRRVADRRQ